MSTKRYLSTTTVALLIAARAVGSVPAEAASSPDSEAASFSAAISAGTTEELQKFLTEFPDSNRVGAVVGELVAQLSEEYCDILLTQVTEEEWRLAGCGAPQQTGTISGAPLTTGAIDDVC